MKLGDILAEKHSSHKGTCVVCERDDVPLNAKDICFPCHIKTPGLGAAIDKVAERKIDVWGASLEGKIDKGENN